MEVVRLLRIDSSRLKEGKKKIRKKERKKEEEEEEKRKKQKRNRGKGGKVKKSKSNPDSDISTSQYRTWNIDIERGTGGTGGLMEEKEDG